MHSIVAICSDLRFEVIPAVARGHHLALSFRSVGPVVENTRNNIDALLIAEPGKNECGIAA